MVQYARMLSITPAMRDDLLVHPCPTQVIHKCGSTDPRFSGMAIARFYSHCTECAESVPEIGIWTNSTAIELARPAVGAKYIRTQPYGGGASLDATETPTQQRAVDPAAHPLQQYSMVGAFASSACCQYVGEGKALLDGGMHTRSPLVVMIVNGCWKEAHHAGAPLLPPYGLWGLLNTCITAACPSNGDTMYQSRTGSRAACLYQQVHRRPASGSASCQDCRAVITVAVSVDPTQMWPLVTVGAPPAQVRHLSDRALNAAHLYF